MTIKLKFETVEARAERVIVVNGRPPNLLRTFSPSEVENLAALIDVDGKLVDDHREKFRLQLIKQSDRLRAESKKPAQPTT